MALLRPLRAGDLHALSLVNGDVFTETFGLSFYLRYLSCWPELCIAAEGPDGALLGYIIGKVEGEGEDWHGHVTALSVCPEARGCGLAGRLLDRLESICSDVHCCLFVDLFARKGNEPAVSFYFKRGYFLHKTEKGYYSGVEDALEMRKKLHPKPTSHQQQQQQLQQQQQQGGQQQGKGKKKKGKKASP